MTAVDWRALATCNDYAGPFPSPWDYDASREERAHGQRICRTVCPVRAECMEAGLGREDSGVWGGFVLDDHGRPLPDTGLCRRGHDLNSDSGRTSDGKCRLCQLERATGYRDARRARAKESA